MKKWFFSNNGKVTAPLDLDAAKDYLATNPDVYAWHPSFKQWKPVNCVSEFVGVLPPTVQAPLIPKEVSDQFFSKKQRLESKLTSIDDSITHSQSSLGKLELQIASYKDLTQNLNDDVKGAIDNIEKKYKNLSRKISQVKDAVHIAEKEMSEVVNDFDHRMSTNDIFMPSCNQLAESKAEQIAKVSKGKIAQEKLATPHRRIDPIEKVETVVKEPIATTQKQVNNTTKKSVLPDSHSAKESFNGMKSMMKSVFKGDKKVEVDADKGKEEPLSMAERLKLAQHNQ